MVDWIKRLDRIVAQGRGGQKRVRCACALNARGWCVEDGRTGSSGSWNVPMRYAKIGCEPIRGSPCEGGWTRLRKEVLHHSQ